MKYVAGFTRSAVVLLLAIKLKFMKTLNISDLHLLICSLVLLHIFSIYLEFSECCPTTICGMFHIF